MEVHDSDQKLFDTVQHGDIDGAQTLLDEGANPNFRNNSGTTPLHAAVKAGYTDVAELLLDYGADPDAKDTNDSTPLHIAVQQRYIAVVQLLLNRWADREVKNKSGSTPLHLVRDETIARLFFDEEPEENKKPLFPVIINGNHLDQSIPPAAKNSETNYILVQSRAPLNPSQRQQLENNDVELQDYVSKNTYLCCYKKVGLLNEIRQMEPIVYVDVYRTQFKISPDLRQFSLEQKIKVDVIFHCGVDSSSEDVQALVMGKSGIDREHIQFWPHKAQLTIRVACLESLTAIDQVRQIEGVRKIELKNNKARLLLGCAGQLIGQEQDPAPQPPVYQGEGQVIAIADTGLDEGHLNPIHQAFTNRVIAMYPQGQAADEDGHGTHVCGSAVGDGLLDPNSGTRVTGTAPLAKLVVQSLWNRQLRRLQAPGSLNPLFDLPYTTDLVRVHSNSWGSFNRDPDGNTIQDGYTCPAREIDQFIWDHNDMVICWAAGNEHKWTENATVGAEAAAKNCITVGASENERPNDTTTYDTFFITRVGLPLNIRNKRMAEDCAHVAAFSARGPTKKDSKNRSRIKPDIVAPGTRILSSRSSRGRAPPLRDHHSPFWYYESGTSMATPLVAGCAAVLREALIKNQHGSPSAALIKALLVNGAEILTNRIDGWSPDSGFGRVNLANSLSIAFSQQPGTKTGIFEDQLDIIGQKELSDKISVKLGDASLKVTLVWSDPPGDLILNSLHLSLKGAGKSKHSPTQYNNVQQVLWNDVPQGDFTVLVGSDRLQKPPQPFAVVWRLCQNVSS